MANNPAPAHVDTSAATANAQPDHVSLRVITLAHGANRDQDLHFVLNLNTRVGELKVRLQSALEQHTQPDHQRLIYQGRPLLDNNATLRSFLRLDPAAPLPVHVLHLVIRDNQPSNPPPSARPQVPQNHLQPNFIPPLPLAGQIPLPPGFPHPAFTTNPHEMLRNSMQDPLHMAIHNQHLAQLHAGQHHANVLHQQPATTIPGNGSNTNTQSHGTTTSAQAGSIPGLNNVLPQNLHPSQAPQIIQSSMTTQVRETIGPNGERIRTVINSTGPFSPHHMAQTTNPVERSASAPGFSRPPGMAPSRTQTPIQHANITVPIPPVPVLPPHMARAIVNPFGAQHFMPQQDGNPRVWLLSSPTGPQALVFAPGHGHFSTMPVTQVTHDHNMAAQPPASIAVPIHTATTTGPAVGPPVPEPANNNTDPPQAEVVLRQPQDQAQPQAAARPQNQPAEDVLGFMLQRGWLFLRLYMFIYVLSEAGTWRRMFMLGLAVFVCLLPRQNPLTDAFGVVRRHVDNLIGPPQAPRRQAEAQRPQNGQNAEDTRGSGSAQTGRTSGSSMPTPEEHARRLLREHQAQNPSVFRSILHSIEQAIALFLASLIPGVGERHVRAREEARRVVQEEDDRRRREAAEGSNEASVDRAKTPDTVANADASAQESLAQGKAKAKDKSPNMTSETAPIEASSTAIEPSGSSSSVGANQGTESEGLRNRGSEISPPATETGTAS